MVGTFGEILQEAPYILEELIEEWEKHEAKVKNQLLVAALKLFFKVLFFLPCIFSQIFYFSDTHVPL
jgi:hypothetical protein